MASERLPSPCSQPGYGTAGGDASRGPVGLGPLLDQDVVAGPTVEYVLPWPADQDVVARAAV